MQWTYMISQMVRASNRLYQIILDKCKTFTSQVVLEGLL